MAVQREQAKLAKKTNKRKKSEQDDSDDDISVEVIEAPVRHAINLNKLNSGTSSNRVSFKTNAVARLTTVDGPSASAKRIAKMREQLKLAKRKADSSTTEDNTLEEEAYQRKLEWLQDRGESEPDKSSDGSADSPDDDDDDQTEN